MAFGELITEKEKELIKKLIDEKTMKEAAEELGISVQAASQRIKRLRDRYEKAKKMIKKYESWKELMPSKYL